MLVNDPPANNPPIVKVPDSNPLTVKTPITVKTPAAIKAPASDRPNSYGNRANRSRGNQIRGFNASNFSAISNSSEEKIVIGEDGTETRIQTNQTETRTDKMNDEPWMHPHEKRSLEYHYLI